MTEVRRAVATDAPVVDEIGRAALGADAWAWVLVEQACAGQVPTVVVLVAERAGQVAGFLIGSLAGDVVELQLVAVPLEHRRAGVASALLAALLEATADTDADRVLLEVREGNAEALAFYTAHGFAAIARRERYYRDGATALVLERRT